MATYVFQDACRHSQWCSTPKILGLSCTPQGLADRIGALPTAFLFALLTKRALVLGTPARARLTIWSLYLVGLFFIKTIFAAHFIVNIF